MGNKNLPILLQKLESDLFLNRIAKRISKDNPNTPIYTIHDNIASTASNLDYITKVVYEEIIDKLKDKKLAA
jgi:hypothetical protein